MTTLDPIIVDQLDGLLTGETNPITVLANASALLNDLMTDLNWAGFYLYNDKTGQLDLGPFQGKVACMHIQPDNGVVGTSYAKTLCCACQTFTNLLATSLATLPATLRSLFPSQLTIGWSPSWTSTRRHLIGLVKMTKPSSLSLVRRWRHTLTLLR